MIRTSRLGIVFLLASTVMLHGCGDSEPAAEPAKINKSEESVAKAPSGKCSVGNPVEEKEVGVVDEFQVRMGPSESDSKIKNEKASAALGKTHYHVIDNSTTVNQLCAQGDWTEVQIVSPQWLSFVRGWAPNSTLRGIDRTSDGMRTFVESDVIWDKDTSAFKPQIVNALNRIARETDGCKDIDPSVVAKSPSRSKPGKPVFFAVCSLNSTPFNAYFEP